MERFGTNYIEKNYIYREKMDVYQNDRCGYG